MAAKCFDPVEKVWFRENPNETPDGNKSLGEIVLEALERTPDVIGQISDDTGIQLTNAEIRLKTIRAIQNLTKLGYKRGDIFGLAARNSHHLAPIVFAAMTIGAPVNTLDPSMAKGL